MTLKNKNIIKVFTKISILSLLFIISFIIGSSLLNANTSNTTVNTKENKDNFNSYKIEKISNIGVAISTNLGTRYTQNSSQAQSIYNEVFSSEDIIKNNNFIKEQLIGKNMLFLKEYFNFVKTDFNTILKNSNKKAITLDNIINQLELRFSRSITNQNLLTSQRDILKTSYADIGSQIINIKKQIETNFSNAESTALYKNIDDYIRLKKEETTIKTYIVFIDEFSRKYNTINSYNKLLLDTFINNKDAISKSSYVVLPDSGSELVKEYGLIFTESGYKENQVK